MTDESSHRQLALGACLLAVTAWSFGPILVRGIGASTPTVVFWRFWIAQPVMIGAAYLTGGRLSLDLLRRTVVPGVLFSGSLIFSFASYEHTSIANATLIGTLEPAVILLVAPRLFGDRTSRTQLVLAAIAFVGMATVVFGAGETSGATLRGDLFALANLAIWTVYFIRVKQERDRGVHAASFLAGVFLVGAVVATPWVLLTSHDLGSLDGSGYLLATLMVVGPGLLGHGSMTWAQRHLDITLASMMTLLHPVIATVLAWLFYRERLTGLQLIGGLAVLFALGGVVRDARGPTPEVQAALPVAAD